MKRTFAPPMLATGAALESLTQGNLSNQEIPPPPPK